MSNSVVRAIKQSLADQLTAQAYFANIPVFVIIPKDIFSQIEEGILPIQGGLAVFIEAFSADNVDPNVPGPYYENGRFTISVVEQPTLNNPASNPQSTGLDCDEVSETAQRYLALFAPNGGGEVCTINRPSEVESKKLSIRRFYVGLPVGFEPIIFPGLPPIVITPAAGAQAYPLTVSLKLQTPVLGAAIYFTIDGSMPSPLNPGSCLYDGGVAIKDENGNVLLTEDGDEIETEPLIINGPCTLRARAYLAGYNSGAPTSTQFS
jgi:hypothetical protein